jgi:hypothetical protein
MLLLETPDFHCEERPPDGRRASARFGADDAVSAQLI